MNRTSPRTEIVTLPVCYKVDGVAAGKRKDDTFVVQEVVPVEIRVIDGVDVSVDYMETTCVVADRRPWLPVVDQSRRPIHDADGMRRYAVAETRQWDRFLMGPHPVEFERGRMDNRRRMVLEDGAEWRSRFRTVKWTNRDEAVAHVAAGAARLAVVDGMVRTDRYEPLVAPNCGWGEHPQSVVADVHNRWRRSTYHGMPQMGGEDYSWLWTVPSDGPLAGAVDWQVDQPAACAAYLAHWTSRLAIVGRDVNSTDTFPKAATWSAVAAAGEVQVVRAAMVHGCGMAFGRDRLEAVLEGLTTVSSVGDPSLQGAVREVANAVEEVRSCLAAYDKAMSYAPVPEDDVAALVGSRHALRA